MSDFTLWLIAESDKCPPITGFCELALCLYTPNLNNLSAKSPTVSDPRMKYSRFWETRAGDRARSDSHCFELRRETCR